MSTKKYAALAAIIALAVTACGTATTDEPGDCRTT